MFLRRILPFGTIAIGIITAILLWNAIGCKSEITPTASPTVSPTVSPILVPCEPSASSRLTPSPTHSPVVTTVIWFLIDRSESMRRNCPHRELLYRIPGFFVAIGKTITKDWNNANLYFAVDFFPGEEDHISPTIASQMEVPPTPADLSKSKLNDYRKSLEMVWGSVNRPTQTVVLLLTDGTFSPGYEQREPQDIREEIGNFWHAGVNTYVVLCADSEVEFWESLKPKEVSVYTLTEASFFDTIQSLGEEILGQWIPKDAMVRAGWFSGLPITLTPLPPHTTMVRGDIIPLRPTPSRYDLYLENVIRGSFYPEPEGDRFTTQGDLRVDSQEACSPQLQIRGKNSQGFYVIWGQSAISAEITPQVSVNYETVSLEVSIKGLGKPDCFTVETSVEGVTSTKPAPLNSEGMAKIEWKPPDQVQPGPLSTSLLVASNGVVLTCPLTLSVKFRPQPITDVVHFFCREQETPPSPPYCDAHFGFNFVVERPAKIELCAPTTPLPNLVDRNPVCGTPFPDDISMSCQQYSQRDSQYCVNVYLDSQLPTPSPHNPIVAWWKEESPLIRLPYQTTYTLQLPKCLLQECGYDHLCFQWEDTDRTTFPHPECWPVGTRK